MANRDAKKIERTLKDFSLGAMSGGAGGLTPIEKLPDTGDVKALYKLPDGSIWSWYSTIKEETIEEHVELGKKYQFLFSDINKTKLEDFLNVVRDKIIELANQDVDPHLMDQYFGMWRVFTEDSSDPARYEFPVGVNLTFEDNESSNESILFAILLGHNVENKVLIDNTSDGTRLNAGIRVASNEGDENLPEYPFQNHLNEEYDEEIEQKWVTWNDEQGKVVIVSEEQMNVIKVEINPEWLAYMKTTFNFDIDLTMLDFLFKLKNETVVVKDEGYRRLDDPQVKTVKSTGGNTYDVDDGLVFDGNTVEFDNTTNGIVITDGTSYIDAEGIHLISGGGGTGEEEWVAPNVTYVQTPTKKKDTGKILRFDGKNVIPSNALPYLTEEPSSDNADGLILVVLDHEPSIKYDGYLYIITEADSSEEEGPFIPVEPLE